MGVSYRQEKDRVLTRLSQIERYRAKDPGASFQRGKGTPGHVSFHKRAWVNRAKKAAARSQRRLDAASD